MLRTYGGIFDEETVINTAQIASKTNQSETKIIQTLEQLQKVDLLEFTHQVSDADIIFLVPREDDHTINRIKHHLVKQNTSKIKKV